MGCRYHRDREHEIRDAIHKEIARQKVLNHFTLNPTPYTQHPTSFTHTLHPTPYTLHHNIRDALYTEIARKQVPTPTRG